MVEKYEPHLIGVTHQGHDFAVQTFDHIMAIKPRPTSVGIEPSQYQYAQVLKTARFDFFGTLGNLLEREGISLIHLTPDTLKKKIDRESEKLPGKLIRYTKPFEGNRGKQLVVHSMTQAMMKTARVRRPDVLVVGDAHALLMRKDMHIPKNKCAYFGVPLRDFRKKRNLKQIIEYRRWVTARKKSKGTRKKP
jgi:hypothetical protein